MKFAVEQRVGTAKMSLQEMHNWPGGQSVLSGHELHTDKNLDTAVATPGDFASVVREKVSLKRYTFVIQFGTVWGSVHLPCHGDVSQDNLWSMLKEMEDVFINVRRRNRTSRIVIGSDPNVSLAPNLVDAFPSSSNSMYINKCLSLQHVGWDHDACWKQKNSSFSWITCLSLTMCMVRPVWCGEVII